MKKILGFILAAGLLLPAAALAAGPLAPSYPPLGPIKNGRPLAAVHYLASGEEGEIRLTAQVLAPGATLEALRIDTVTGRASVWRSDGEGGEPLTVAREGETLADGRGKMNFGPLGEAEELLELTLADNDGAFQDRQAEFRVTFFMAGGARALCLLKAADQPATYLARTSKEAPAARAQQPDKPKQAAEALKPQAAEAPKQQPTVEERAGDVFVAGAVHIGHLEDGGVSHATLWKNGVAQTLSSAHSYANSVFVSGGDVFVAGEDRAKATLWKNGVAQTLSSADSYARSVFVSGGDVFVVGGGRDKATLWKNGVAQTLSSAKSGASSVFVSGGDVFVAGYVHIGDYEYLATLWKNGVAQTLSSADHSSADSVFVSGGDVFVTGSSDSHATLWKNGAAQTLSSSADSGASSVFVSGGDVFVAGRDLDDRNNVNRATLWKNGVAQALSGEDSGAGSVFVSGGDVFVAGGVENPNDDSGYIATLWKNGVAQTLSSADSSAGSVFVGTK